MSLSCQHITAASPYLPLICDWYADEWNIPAERTRQRLSKCRGGIPLQLLVFLDDVPVATGGIHHEVNMPKVYPEFLQYGPWVALVYTAPAYRNRGIGAYLCDCLDQEATKNNLHRYYLYTYTAENLYRRKGWQEMRRIIYRGEDTVVMTKQLD